MTVDVAVVGGGISGLAAAHQLQRLGARVRLLEATARVGGVIRTDRFDGWVIDGGPDAMLLQKPAAVELCRELGLAERLVSTLPPRTAYVLRDGRLHPLAEGSFLGFPLRLGALARSSLFSLPGKVRMACEAAIPAGPLVDDESIASFVRRRFGQEAVNYLAEPLLAGIHAGDVDQLSVHALFPRLVAAERRSGSVLRAFRVARAAPSPQGAFVSLPGGVGELVDALESAISPGTIATSSPVTSLDRADTFVIDTTGGSLRARAVVIATPAYVTAQVVGPTHSALAALCADVAYASTATVALGYRRDQIDHPLRGSGFVVPRVERSPLLAGTWVTSKWPHRAPEGHVLVRAFLGGGRDPRCLDQSDEALIEAARSGLAGIVPTRGAPLFARLYRWTRQSPQFTVGHLRRVGAIENALAQVPGLFLTGSGFRLIGIPDCVADAREAAGRAAAYLATSARS